MPFYSQHCVLHLHGREERRGLGVKKLSTQGERDIEVSEGVVDVGAGARLRNHVHVQGVRVRETLGTDMILVGNVEVFLVDLRPALFHVMLTHLIRCGVSLTITGLATDWLSILMRICRGCSRGE